MPSFGSMAGATQGFATRDARKRIEMNSKRIGMNSYGIKYWEGGWLQISRVGYKLARLQAHLPLVVQ